MIRPQLLLLSALALTFACDKPGAETKSETKPAEASKQDEPTQDEPKADEPKQVEQPKQAKADKPTPKKPKLDEAKQLRRQLLKLLNEGRALTKAGDYAGGMTKYREALKIDASDVSVLAELGWAAYKSGDLELAHRTTVNALKFVREDKRRGMILYNLGRIEEDRNNAELAIEHYQHSLLARPGNKTVQGRLDALIAAQKAEAASPEIDPEPSEDYTPLPALARDLGDLAAACKAIVDARCEDFTMDEGVPCSCEPKLQATPGADESWGLLEIGSEDIPMQRAWFPAVKTDAGWTVFAEVLYEYNPGAFGIFEEVEFGTSTLEPVLDKGSALVMHVGKRRMDRDMGINEIEDEVHSAVVICARSEAGAHCTRALYESYRYTRDVEFEDFEDEGDPIDHEGLPIDEGFEASFSYADGTLTVSWAKTYGSFAGEGDMWGGWILKAGQYSLAQLLGLE